MSSSLTAAGGDFRFTTLAALSTDLQNTTNKLQLQKATTSCTFLTRLKVKVRVQDQARASSCAVA